MAKITEELVKDLDSEEYDILEDIQDEDYVFVVNGSGQLKGISWPSTLEDDEDLNTNIEEIIKFLVSKFKESVPEGTTVH